MSDVFGSTYNFIENALGMDPATKASEAQEKASTASIAEQRRQFDINQANQRPWLESGTTAVNQLSAGLQPGGQFSTVPQLNFDPSKVNVTQDPGYQFRMQQGVDALKAAGAAAGNLGSGNMGVALTNYGQQLGSQEYGNAYARAYQSALDQYNSAFQGQNTLFNRLSGLAGTGQVSAAQVGSAGQNMANQIGANLMDTARITGVNRINAGINNVSGLNAIGNSAGTLGNQLANYYTNQNALQNWQAYQNYGVNPVDYGGGGVTQGTDMYAGDLRA